jgi:hypothetical protein
MKKLLYISIIFSTVLFSCKFRTPKSEQDAINNRIVENSDVITVRTPAIVMNYTAIDKDNYQYDTVMLAGMTKKYLDIYSQAFGGNFEVRSTKCTSLVLQDDSLEIKHPSLAFGTRSLRMVAFVPGKEPLYFGQMPEVGELALQLKKMNQKDNSASEEQMKEQSEEILKKEKILEQENQKIEEKK